MKERHRPLFYLGVALVSIAIVTHVAVKIYIIETRAQQYRHHTEQWLGLLDSKYETMKHLEDKRR